MGRSLPLFVVLTVTFGGWLATSVQAQQSPTPARRPSAGQAVAPQASGPRSAAPRHSQPRLVTDAQARPAAAVAGQPAMPKNFPLTQEQEARVDQILKFWEHHTAKIKTHECKFVRKNYDFVFGNRDTPITIDVGTIRFMDPDKGLFRVDETYKVNAQAADPKQRYVPQDVQFGEYWVCDGEAIFQFDARTKVLTETKLPPEMQGKAIAEGPLPFLFGAKAETMKARYWIREVTPQNNPQGEYLLEATPKRQEDAANFDHLLVQLKVEQGQLLPHAMRVDKGPKQGYVLYEFKEHAPNHTAHRLLGFLNSFVRPSTPAGWTKVVEDWNAPPADTRQAARPQPKKRSEGGKQR
jgi:TIGR03009 family protein